MKNKSFFATLVFIVIFGIGIILAYAMNKVSIGIGAFIIALLVSFAIKIADQWNRAVVLRLGQFHSLRGPGLFFIIPVIDTLP